MKKGIINKISVGANVVRPRYRGITLISLVVTIVIMLILAGVGIYGSLALIEQAKYSAFINEMKQVEEAVALYILEKQLESGEQIELFDSKLQLGEEQIAQLPQNLQNEINYIREKLAGTDVTEKIPSDYSYAVEIGDGKNICYLPSELVNGKKEAYIYDEQSASVYKVEPTIIWGVEMHGYEYGNLLTTQTGLLERVKNATEGSVADLIETTATTNTYTQDKYGNKIVIPAGFRVVANGTDGVVYSYDKEAEVPTNIPVVQDGIVIEHATDGNQFVWVPIGIIKNDAQENTTNTTEIKLGRYENYTMGTNNTPPEPTQLASDWNTNDDTTLISSSYQEYASNSSYENTKAYNLQTWLKTAQDNGGYYIARYEASYGKTTDKVLSQPSIGTPAKRSDYTYDTTIDFTSKYNQGQLWNYINQPTAATVSRAMYPNQTVENAEYYSDLVNSYAWDTTIIFIQTYSEKTTYASQKSIYDNTDDSYQPANTGERGETAAIGKNTTDKVCNIYDMASNAIEWTTETSTNSGLPCAYRGGNFLNTSFYTSYRRDNTTISSNYNITFRPLLYVRGK